MRILVIDDDELGSQYLSRALSESGHVVDVAHDGALGLAMACEDIYELLIIDRLLPAMDGLTLVRRLRRHDPHLPLLMLSALATPLDRAEGIRSGCDDYLAKPYATSELLARIEALARRAGQSYQATSIEVGALRLNTVSRQVWLSGESIPVQPREWLLLEFLMRHAGQVVTRSMLLEAVWDYDFDPRGAVIDTHVHRLRRKLRDADGMLIRTLPGVGYLMSDTPPVGR